MAFGKKALGFAKKGLAPDTNKKKESKTHHFMAGLKDWFTSPGGIITLVLIIGTIAYVHHRTSDK